MKKALPLLCIVILVIITSFALKSPIKTIHLTPKIETPVSLKFGAIPFVQPKLLRKYISPVYEYIGHKLKLPTSLSIVSDYEALGALLKLKKVQIALFSQTSFLMQPNNENWEVLCRPIQKGKLVYRGKIIVKQGSSINSIHDLKDKTFAYVDRMSGSGFIYPNKLFKASGIKPLSFFSNIVFSHSHMTSCKGVVSGKYDGASVFSTELFSSKDSPDEVKIIASTEPIPNDPVVVRKDMPQELKAKIKTILTTMHKDPEGKPFIDRLIEARGITEYVAEEKVQALIEKMKSGK